MTGERLIYFGYNASKSWDYEPILILDCDLSLKPKDWILNQPIKRVADVMNRTEKFFYVEGQTAISGLFEGNSIYNPIDFSVVEGSPFLKQIVIYYITEHKEDFNIREVGVKTPMINIRLVKNNFKLYVYFSFTVLISSAFRNNIKESFEDWNYLSHLAKSWKNFVIDNDYLGIRHSRIHRGREIGAYSHE